MRKCKIVCLLLIVGGIIACNDKEDIAPVRIERVLLNKTTLVLHESDQEQLVATVLPENALVQVQWSSSDHTIASVSDGKVQAHKNGKVIITAQAGDKTANCTIQVLEKNPGAILTIDPDVPIFFEAYPASYDERKVAVTTNQPNWNVVADKDWIKIRKCPDGEPNFFVSAKPNTTSIVPLKAILTVTAGNAKPVEIEVTQEAISLLETAEVGDYFYLDGTFSKDLDPNKKCIGVVFVEKTGVDNGLIVAPDELERTTWALTATATGANSLSNGAENMEKIKLKKDWQRNYPTFAWCATKGEEWFMPARIQLNTLVSVASGEGFSTKLLRINGAKPILKDAYYWSSTEDASQSSWAWAYAKGINASVTKGASGAIRAVREF